MKKRFSFIDQIKIAHGIFKEMKISTPVVEYKNKVCSQLFDAQDAQSVSRRDPFIQISIWPDSHIEQLELIQKRMHSEARARFHNSKKARRGKESFSDTTAEIRAVEDADLGQGICF